MTIEHVNGEDGRRYQGGFYGVQNNETVTFINCYTANVTMTNAGSEYGKPITSSGVGNIVNCFYYNVVTNSGAAQTSEGYTATASYIYDTLGWSSDVWNVTDGSLPILEARQVEVITFAGGTGSVDDPYQISNIDQLKLMRDLINNGEAGYKDAAYILTADIDLGGEEWVIVGDGDQKIFNGVFDGDGHSITNFTITTTYHSFYAAFFAKSTGTIRGLRLADFTVSTTSAGMLNWTAGIVACNDGTIDACMVQHATISAASSGSYNMAAAITAAGAGSVTNCWVDDATISLGSDTYFGLGAMYGSSDNSGCVVTNNFVSNVTFSAADTTGFNIIQGCNSGVGVVEDNTYYNVVINGAAAVNADGYEATSAYVFDTLGMDSTLWGVDSTPYLLAFGPITIDPVEPVEPEKNPSYKITVSGPSAAVTADTVTFNFALTDVVDMTGILSVNFDVPYNASALTYVSMTHNAPDGWTVSANAADGTVKVFAADDTVAAPSADLTISLTFTVNADFSGDVTIAASNVEGSDDQGAYLAGTGSETTIAVTALEFALTADSAFTLNDGILVLPLNTTADSVKAAFTSDVTVAVAEGASYVGTGVVVSNAVGSATVLVKGDLNGNGELESNDAALIRALFLGWDSAPVGEVYELAADVNGNSKTDSNDYIRVQMAVLGILALDAEPVEEPSDPYADYTTVTYENLFAKLAVCGRGNALFAGSGFSDQAEYFLIGITAEQYAQYTLADCESKLYRDSTNDTNWSITHNFGTIFDLGEGWVTDGDSAATELKFFTVHSVNASEGFEGYFLGVYAPNGYTASSDVISFRLIDTASETIHAVTISEMGSLLAPTTDANGYPVMAFTGQIIQEVLPDVLTVSGAAKLPLFGWSVEYSSTKFGSTGEYFLIEINEEMYNTLTNDDCVSIDYKNYDTDGVYSRKLTHNFGTILDIAESDTVTGDTASASALKFFTQKVETLSDGSLAYRLGVYAPNGYTVDAATTVAFSIVRADSTINVTLNDMYTLSALQGEYPTMLFPDQYITEIAATEKETIDVSGQARIALFGYNTSMADATAWGGAGGAQFWLISITEKQYTDWTNADCTTVHYYNMGDTVEYDLYQNFGTIFDIEDGDTVSGTNADAASILRFFTYKTVAQADGTTAYYLGVYANADFTPASTTVSFSVEDSASIINITITSFAPLVATEDGSYPTLIWPEQNIVLAD